MASEELQYCGKMPPFRCVSKLCGQFNIFIRIGEVYFQVTLDPWALSTRSSPSRLKFGHFGGRLPSPDGVRTLGTSQHEVWNGHQTRFCSIYRNSPPILQTCISFFYVTYTILAGFFSNNNRFTVLV